MNMLKTYNDRNISALKYQNNNVEIVRIKYGCMYPTCVI